VYFGLVKLQSHGKSNIFVPFVKRRPIIGGGTTLFFWFLINTKKFYGIIIRHVDDDNDCVCVFSASGGNIELVSVPKKLITQNE
jgi:hypothetical protein